ncbi:(2Fe-2S)-binding protein [Bacillota bacterium Lsc_1132]
MEICKCQTSYLLQKNGTFIEVNGCKHTLHVPSTTHLVAILRYHLELTGTKISCEIGRCDACSVLVNGSVAASCLVMAYQIHQTSITTIEGLSVGAKLHPIQQAFLEEGGFQCGYCTPGMIISVKALLDADPTPTQEKITEALSGNLFRCTGYGGIIRAVQKANTYIKAAEERRNQP